MNFYIRVCKNCKKIYDTRDTTMWILFVTAVILFSVSTSTLTNFEVDGIAKVLCLAGMIGAIAIIIYLFRRQRNCKVCKGKKALFRLSTLKAQQIIKENNLSVPES